MQRTCRRLYRALVRFPTSCSSFHTHCGTLSPPFLLAHFHGSDAIQAWVATVSIFAVEIRVCDPDLGRMRDNQSSGLLPRVTSPCVTHDASKQGSQAHASHMMHPIEDRLAWIAGATKPSQTRSVRRACQATVRIGPRRHRSHDAMRQGRVRARSRATTPHLKAP